jgi:hypothetical protein
MKEKILAQLKVKYPGAPAKLLGLTADKLTAKVTEEDMIEGAIGELENQVIPFTEVIAEYQKEGDERVAAAKKKWEKATPKKADDKTDEPPADDKPPADDMPSWAKALLAEVQTLKADKQQTSIQQKLAENEKLKGIDKRLWEKWKLPEKEEDIDTFATEVATHFADFAIPANNGSNPVHIPGKGKQNGKDVKPTDKELDGILSNIKI